MSHFGGKIEFVYEGNKSSSSVKRNSHCFNLKLNNSMTSLHFENNNFNALNFSVKNVIIDGRLKYCGMEDRTVVAHG